MAVFRDMTRQTVIYGVSAGLNGAVGFILIPIVTRYLVPKEYGTYALLEIAIQFLLTIYGLGLNVSVLKAYSAAPDSESKTSLINNVLIFSTSTSFIFSAGIFVFAGLIAEGFFGGVAESFILYTGFIVFFESIWALFLTIFRAEQKPGKYIFASSLQVVIVAAVTIVFVAGMGEKAEGIFKGRLIGDIVVSGILLWSHRKQFSSAYSWNRIRELLAYGLPYLPAGLAIIWINLSGRYFLHRYSTLDEVGIYAIAQKLSGLVNLLIIQPFGAAWFPIMFEVEKSNDAPLLYSRMTTYYVFCAAFSFLMFTLLMPEIFSILTSERYNNGTRVFPILMLAFLIYGLFYTLAIGIFLKSQNWVMPYIYGAGIIINVILNVTLIHQDGARGAALAMLLTFFVVSGCQGFIAQRFYPIPFEFNRLGKIILVGGTLLWVGHFFMNLGTSYLILRMGLIALFPIVLYGMGFYTQLEIRKALEFSRLARVQGTLIAKSMLRMKKTIRDER